METTVLQKVEEVFGLVNDPSVYANYSLNKSTNEEDGNSETITITKEIDNPFSDCKFSFPFDMTGTIEKLKAIKKEYATIEVVLGVFAYHPSGTIRKYFEKIDFADFAKFIVVQWDAKKFGL